MPDRASPAEPARPGEPVRLTALVRGRVQGVGMREYVRWTAGPLELTGSAMNLPDGRVEVIAEGPRSRCEVLLAALRGAGTPGRVTGVEARWGEATGEHSTFLTGARPPGSTP